MTRTIARWRTFGALAAAVVALLVLSACGAAEGGDVASAGGDANPTVEGTEQEPLSEEAQVLVFADCMRDNGFDMPDPGPGQAGLIVALQEARGGHDDQATVDEIFDAAFAACEALLPELVMHGNEHERDEDAMLRLAECLREEGIDVSDDLFGGGGGAMHDGDKGELDAALETCREVAGDVWGER